MFGSAYFGQSYFGDATGVVGYEGDISTNIPAATTFLKWWFSISNNTAASVIAVDIIAAKNN